MPVLLHQVRMPFVTNLPKDVTVNTFWTLGGSDRVQQAEDAADALVDFYTEPPGGGDEIANWLSARISRGAEACSVVTYDISDPKPRPPIHVRQFSMPSASNTASLPDEVALVLSFHGEPAAGIPQARRRGRIYLGPLWDGAATAAANEPSRPSTTLITQVQAAAVTLASTLNGENGAPQWIVYSRVSANNAPVIGGWVDNAWDTQRRRGADPTTRNTWAVNV